MVCFRRACVAVLLLTMAAWFVLLADEPCTVTVQPGESIQAAIDAAPEGAVICLAEGEWEEHLDIQKSLTLRGSEDGTTVRGHKADTPVLRVRAPGGEDVEVLIEALSVAGGSGMYGPGIRGMGGARATIKDCLVFGNDYGIRADDGTRIEASGVTVSGNNLTGLWFSDTAQAIVTDCNIVHNGASGIWMVRSARVRVEESTITSNREGISVWYAARAAITDSRISGSVSNGIVLRDFAQATIMASTIEDNEGDGIRIKNSAQATVIDCRIGENDAGIRISGNARVAIEESMISHNRQSGVILELLPIVTTLVETQLWEAPYWPWASPEATIDGSALLSNGHYGVLLVAQEGVFTGRISGEGNRIPAPGDLGGNEEGAVYPGALAFLMTEEGGALYLCGLNVVPSPGGTVIDPGEGEMAYEHGTVVPLRALPDSGYRFLGWTGDTESMGDPEAAETTIEMLGDYGIAALFEWDHGHPDLNVGPGWTLFGMSRDPEDPNPDALQVEPVPAFSYLYRWDPGTRRYLAAHRDEITELEKLHGYWLYLSREHAAYEACVEGTALTGEQEVELGPAGWQMIGVPYPVAWGDADGGSMRFRNNTEEKTLAEAITAGWVLNTIYAWDSTEGAWIRYRAADGETLEPWTGYFLYTLQDDLELIFSEEQAAWPAGFAWSVAARAYDPGEPPLPVLPVELPVQGLDAVAYPNPVADGVGVTFTVRGPEARWVEAISVRVHDLSGRLVYQGEGDGGSLLWDTMGVTGAPVASGVYLYTVQAKLDGEWVSAAVEKLLILR